MKSALGLLGVMALSQVDATPTQATHADCSSHWSAIAGSTDPGVPTFIATSMAAQGGAITQATTQVATDISASNFYAGQPFWFKVSARAGRKHLVRVTFEPSGSCGNVDSGSLFDVLDGNDADTDCIAAYGTLEGGQARTTVGASINCRWGSAEQTIYKWTPGTFSANEADIPGDMWIEVIAIGAKTEPMYYTKSSLSPATDSPVVVNPSGATSVTDGQLEPDGLGCAEAFTTTDITAPVGAGSASGDKHTFECSSGVASGEAICANGQWNKPTCGTPGLACGTAFTTDYITADVGASTANGATATFTCETGFSPSGTAKCTNGNWDTPRCLKNGSPCVEHFYTEDINQLVGAGSAHGTTVTFACSGAKTPSGQATCTNGKFDSPTCVGQGPNDPSPNDKASSLGLGSAALVAASLLFC